MTRCLTVDFTINLWYTCAFYFERDLEPTTIFQILHFPKSQKPSTDYLTEIFQSDSSCVLFSALHNKHLAFTIWLCNL